MDIVKTFSRMKAYPLGKGLFTFLVCRRLPYFSSMRAEDFKPGRVEVPVDLRDASNESVMSAVITLDVKTKPDSSSS